MTRLLTCAALLLCACATPAEKKDRAKEMVLYSTPGAPKPEGKMVCALEYPTGSNIAKRVCRYQNQVDWNAQQAQQQVMDLQHRGCMSTPGLGSCGGN